MQAPDKVKPKTYPTKRARIFILALFFGSGSTSGIVIGWWFLGRQEKGFMCSVPHCFLLPKIIDMILYVYNTENKPHG